ncbi:MAG TPA: cytochrome c [Terriglobia bacterium]|nr:cytochrome c [Terriglobia bacterium]
MRILLGLVIALAQPAPGVQSQNLRSVTDGVYTPAQASRGELLVVETVGCVNCHGGTLRGGTGDTPPLVGPEFIGHWQDFTLSDLGSKISKMPPTRSEPMKPQDYVDIMTFLLQINGYPPGENELVPDLEVLRQVKIVPPKTP